MTWFLIILFGFLAGLVQGLTGFGAAIMMMIFLPSILPIAESAGVASLIMAASVLTLVLRYRHDIHLKRIIIPFLVYASVAAWSVHLVRTLDVHLLRMLLGGLLIALSLYFSFNKKSRHPTLSVVRRRHLHDYLGLLQRFIWYRGPAHGALLPIARQVHG